MKKTRLLVAVRRFFASALLMATMGATAAFAEEVPVFITLGQSNADGSAMFDATIDSQMQSWYSSSANTGKLKMWYRSTQVENQTSNALGEPARWVVDGTTTDVAPGWLNLWYRNENTAGRTAMNMIHNYGSYSTGTGTDCAQGRRGMEPEFGRKFAEAFPSKELYMIKLGVSGSQLSTWANPADNHNWDYFFEKVYKPAIDDLIAQGKTPVLAGVWWMQGCADAAYDQAYYETWLRTLITKIRTQLGFPNAKIYIGHIVGPGENATYPNGSIQYGAGVRAAQDALAADMDNVEVIDTKDCPLQYEANFSGYLHFSHAGVNAIGDILAEKVIADQANWDTYTGYSNASTQGVSSSSPGYLDCTGSTDRRYMRIPNHSDFTIPASGSMTISFDLTTNAWAPSGNFYGLVCNNYRNANSYRSGFDLFQGSSAAQSLANNFSPDGTSTSTTNVQNFGGAYITSGITIGTPAHIVMTYNGSTGTQNIYINGTLMRTTTNANKTLPITSFADILVGCRYLLNDQANSLIATDQCLNGKIDNLRFYRDALTAAEVVSDASGAVAGKTLIAAYDFDFLTGNNVPDITGHGHDGVLVNFPDYTVVSNGVTVTIENTIGGTLTVTNGSTTLQNGSQVAIGSTLTLSATAATDYEFGAFTVNGVDIDGCTVTADADVTIGVRFVRDSSAPSRSAVFLQNEDGSRFYRIPALAVAADGSVVALADKRGSSIGDLPNTISVVCKRSTDGGQTWGNAVTIAQGDAATSKTYGDPAVVLDRNTGNLIAVFSGDTGFFTSTKTARAGFYVSKSTDNGVSWSTPRAITDQIYQSNWYGAFCASGRMLQTASGRILFVANARTNSDQSTNYIYEYVCASDDGGETWRVLNPSTTLPAGPAYGNESKLVELSDGSLIMSIRSVGKRRFAKSTDGGVTWTAATDVNELVEPGCNGDIMVYPSTDGRKRMLHSVPNHASSRENVTVFLSYDEGATWPVKKSIVTGLSQYSSLCVLPDGTIGICVEEGDNNGIDLYYQNFSLSWLTDGADDGTGGVPSNPSPGYLDCDGTRYMKIPNNDVFTIPANGSMSITFDGILSQWATTYYGWVCNNYRNSAGYRSGFDIFTGSSSAQTIANNFSPDGTSTQTANVQNFGGAYVTSGLTPGTKAHIAMTYDGSTGLYKIYINGTVVRENTNTNKSLPITSFADILVGARYLVSTSVNGSPIATDQCLKGQIDNLRFYREALTAAEVSADATGVVEGKTLLAAYDFNDINGSTVSDISGNGHNGVLVNFPQYTSSTTGYTLTITPPDADKGSIAVYNGSSIVTSGQRVEENTELTVRVTPTARYLLDKILVNGTAIEGNTFVITADSRVSATFMVNPDAPVEYCTTPNSATIADRTGRKLNSFTLSDGTTNLAVTVGQSESSTTTSSATYFDRTTNILTTTPGSTISFSALSWTGAWMHGYAYIDYNKDGVFNQTTNADGSTDGELVAFSYYNAADADGASAPNSRGVSAGRGAGVTTGTMPNFTLPTNLSGGDYRLRFKIDWNSLDPCGSVVVTEGGCIVDVTIHIDAPEERTVTIRANDDSMGTVAIQGTDALTITTADNVTIMASPAAGFQFNGWYRGDNKASDAATYTYTGTEDADFVAHFGEKTYPVMSHTFTNGASDQNRYLKKVTTADTETPVVFEAASTDELPYTVYPVGAGVFTTVGANIDKTATHIRVARGTTSFPMTLYAWTSAIEGRSAQLNWTQCAHYVDWNGDKEFAGQDEISDLDLRYGNSNKPKPNPINDATGMTVTVNLPADQPVGEYRMRLVFYEPSTDNQDGSNNWHEKLFTELNGQIRNGVSYDFIIEVVVPEVNVDLLVQTSEGETGIGGTALLATDINGNDAAGETSDSTITVPQGATLHVFATPESNFDIGTIVVALADEEGQTYEDNMLEKLGDNYHLAFTVEGNTTVSVTFAPIPLSIDSILSDLNTGRAEVYDLRGIKVNADNILRGNVYILRTGNTIQKVLMK